MWVIFWVGAGSFVPLLFLQYVGEEAVYTIIAQEMRANQEYFVTTLYGNNYGRPGLYSLIILLLSSVLGEEHLLIAARLVAACSTLLTGLTLAWLIRKLFNDRLFAAFATAVFLSGDVLLRRGWVAYSDPMFSFFTFGAMACLWVATAERRTTLLFLAALALIGSFLTKAPTGYVFYAVLAIVLIWRHPNRDFLFAPWSVSIHLAAVAFPIVWNYAIAANTVFPTVLEQVMAAFRANDVVSFTYVFRRLGSYPLRIVWHLFPISAIVLYCLFSRRVSFAALRQNSIAIAVLVVAINLLPYWLASEGRTRYIMPLYPLFALVMTYVVLNSGRVIIDFAVKALILTVGVAYVSSSVGLPLYEHYKRGSYDNAAQAIATRAGEFPIFATDDTAIGLSIVADLNRRRAPKAPITTPPAQFASGFILAKAPNAIIGPVDTTLDMGRNANGRRTRYLLCRGDACLAAGGSAGRRLSF
jgi:4-amino-4-deoxy-L-arabinose transferase-like glycosyltransferase